MKRTMCEAGITQQMRKLSVNNINTLIYSRCSTKQQNEDNLHSNASQEEICTHYANENGFKIIGKLSDVTLGHNITKLSINEILNNGYFKGIKINHIIIKDPSRLSREPAQGTQFAIDCKKLGIIIHSVSDNIDTDSNQGLKQFSNLFWDANIESQQVSKRVKTTLQAKKRNGSYIGRTPFGKQKIQSATLSGFPIKVLEENEQEQKVIQFIIMLYYGEKLKKANTLLNLLINEQNQQNQQNEQNQMEIQMEIQMEAQLYYIKNAYTLETSLYTTNILFGELTIGFIPQILNNFGILKKGNKWSKYAVSTVIENCKKIIPNPRCLYPDGWRSFITKKLLVDEDDEDDKDE